MHARRLAYDGRGNAVVRSAEDLPAAVASLGGYEKGLYAEKWVPFVAELAVSEGPFNKKSRTLYLLLYIIKRKNQVSLV